MLSCEECAGEADSPFLAVGEVCGGLEQARDVGQTGPGEQRKGFGEGGVNGVNESGVGFEGDGINADTCVGGCAVVEGVEEDGFARTGRAGEEANLTGGECEGEAMVQGAPAEAVKGHAEGEHQFTGARAEVGKGRKGAIDIIGDHWVSSFLS